MGSRLRRSVFYACGGRIPPQRDWSRRAFGPQLSGEHVIG